MPKKYENGQFYQLPKNLHRVVANSYEFSILAYLLQCENEGKAFPSYNTMAQGLMSRREVIRAIKSLISKGYLTKEPQHYHSNIYHIIISKLVTDIHQCLTVTSDSQSPSSDSQSPPLVTHSHPNNTKLNNTKITIPKEYIKELKLEFPNVDIDEEYKKFVLWWGEGKKKLKRPKLAFRNWIKKAAQITPGKNAGVNRINTDDPDKYIKGKYGHMVRR